MLRDSITEPKNSGQAQLGQHEAVLAACWPSVVLSIDVAQ